MCFFNGHTSGVAMTFVPCNVQSVGPKYYSCNLPLSYLPTFSKIATQMYVGCQIIIHAHVYNYVTDA